MIQAWQGLATSDRTIAPNERLKDRTEQTSQPANVHPGRKAHKLLQEGMEQFDSGPANAFQPFMGKSW
jgi:hypothetical protein